MALNNAIQQSEKYLSYTYKIVYKYNSLSLLASSSAMKRQDTCDLSTYTMYSSKAFIFWLRHTMLNAMTVQIYCIKQFTKNLTFS